MILFESTFINFTYCKAEPIFKKDLISGGTMNHKKFSIVILLLFVFASDSSWSQDEEGKTLYARLGGYDAIAAVTDNFLGRLIKEPQLTRFFAGHSDHSKMKLRQLVVDQIC